MKELTNRLNHTSPIMVSVFRIVIGLLFLMHGTQKLLAWPVGMSGGSAIPTGMWPLWYAAVIETFIGVLLLVGFATRAAAFVGSGEMAVAYFTVHLPGGVWPIENQGEDAVLFCFALLLLVFIGGGAWGIDALRSRRPEPAAANR